MNGRKGKSMVRKHTAAEKNAYYSGMGYAVAYCGKGITFRKDNVRKSFQAGWNRGHAMMKKSPAKYPKLSSKR